MTGEDVLETDFIVLRKIPYSERAVIVSGISPEYGKMGFIVNGASGGLKRNFPELDLFRLLHVTFVNGRGELCKVLNAELLENFDGVVSRYDRFEAAGWLANFTLQNLMPMLPHPHFANALEVALRRLANGEELPVAAILTGACMAFLFEEGWLACAVQSEAAREQCRVILEMAAGNPAPQLSDLSWQQQFDWCRDLLLYNECKLP